ncbi:uncharacterized protein A1O5_04618 [Cladophialophora psammophila CBS 110553]|uniref:Uncharacterized protein n=1 Tax=Cladophialophora psammophila CBS 110553 TaxID=1182543 RepID=W9XP47_9EURO|nr:uncharacterized protein A1O5_04618 [Cladophialophora psammophila CBS 110553]EXJ72114.1 hypothetical protein A1O5_04618 [Cladophialophora psammophila CBS 110553]
MKLLFIPCDGEGQARKTVSDEGVTRTQHAAREYHKKAKLRRARNKGQLAHGTRKSTKSNSTTPTDELAVLEVKAERQSPIQILLGASRSDPFNTIGDPDAPLYVHEMLDHAISCHYSEMCLTDGGGLNAARTEIMQSVMYSPVAWYTIIFAGATHNAYQYGGRGTTKQNEQLRLVYKTKAIRSLLDYIQENGDTVSEEALLSMITLASHGSGENLKGHDSYTRQKLPFLSHLHDVDYYASMDIGMEHLAAVYAIVDRRGGLRTLQRKSLAIVIQVELQRPHFNLLAPTKWHISKRSHQPDAVAQAKLETLTTGFHTLIDDGYISLDHLVAIADCTSLFSADFDQLLRCYDLPEEQRPLHTPNMALVRYMRWCVLHDILMLPEHSNTDGEILPEHVLYQICRHVLFAYAVFVVVPMPPRTKLHAKIAERLRRLLVSAVKVGLPRQQPDLFFCAVAWGWMCTEKAVGYRKLEKLSGSFTTLLEFTEVRRKPDSWPIVEEIMKSFLWMEAYCEEPGRKFWAGACGQAEEDLKGEESP